MRQFLLSLLLLASMGCYAQQLNNELSLQKTASQKLFFMQNKGQVANAKGQPKTDVLFTAKANGAQLWLTATGIHYQFSKTDYPAGYNPGHKKADFVAQQKLREQAKQSTHRFTVELVGSNQHPKVVTEKEGEYTENYYLAHCPNGITGVKSFEKITYKNVYPNIDWVIYSNGGYMEYDFIVHAGGNPGQIKLKVNDADKVTLTNNGELLVKTKLGEVREKTPVSYNEAGKPIATHFVMHKDGSLGFAGAFPKNKTLRIDPEVVWATYYGGTDYEQNPYISGDSSGNLYLSGTTNSSTAIASGGYDNTLAGNNDIFLAKFTGAGTRLWATYYGGTGTEYLSTSKVDGNGNIYLAGTTNSTSGIASGGYQNTLGGGYDALLIKFTSSGALSWATYYGGTGWDDGNDCAIDSAGNMYLSGYSYSTSGIASGGFQNTLGGSADGFIVKFSANGSRLWGTYYGGTGSDVINSIGLDSSNNFFIAGHTDSTTNIASSGSHLSVAPGTANTTNVFLAKFNASGTRLWATYYGGEGREEGRCTVASDGNVYLSGVTSSTTGIAFNGFQNTFGGGGTEPLDAYLAKFTTSGSLLWGTYYGGTGDDFADSSTTIDSSGNVYLYGATSSTSGITFGGFQNTYGGGSDAFIAKFNSSGGRLWGSYFGGRTLEEARSCFIDNSGAIYLAGYTISSSGIAQNGFQNTLGGQYDAFIAKISETTTCPAPRSPFADATSATRVNLGWATPTTGNPIGYEYAVTTSATPPQSGTPTTFIDIIDYTVTAGTTYYLHVRSTCNGTYSSWATSAPFTGRTATCNPPASVTATATSTTTVNLAWTVPATGTPTGYEYAVTTSATPPASGTATATSISGYTINPSTTYYLHVRTNCNGVFSSWVTSAPFTGTNAGIAGENCANAINLAAFTSPYSGTTVGAAHDYNITCISNNNGGDLFFYIDVPNNATLVIGQTYNNYDSENYIGYGGSCPGTTRINCFDDEDYISTNWTNTTGSTQRVYWVQSGYLTYTGNFTLAWTLTVPCGNPTNITGSATSATTATLNWAAPTTGTPSGYQTLLNTTLTTPSANLSTDNYSAGTTAQYPSIAAGTTYYYWVRSICGATAGTWTYGGSFTTPAAGCTVAPGGLYPSNAFTPACTGIDEFIIGTAYAGEYSMLSLTANTTYTVSSSIATDYITITNIVSNPVAYGSTSVTFTPTVSGTYRFYIHTNSDCGTANVSRTKYIRCGSLCTAPATVSAQNITSTSAQITWPATSEASTNYQVYVSTSATAPSSITTATPTSGIVYTNSGAQSTTTGLTASTVYYYWVRTLCSTSNSAWTAGGSFTTAFLPGCTNAPYGQVSSEVITPSCLGSEFTHRLRAGAYGYLNLTANTAYTLSSTVTTDYITVTDQNGSTVVAYGTTPLSFTPSTGGVLRYYIHTNAACETSGDYRNVYIECNNAPCEAPTNLLAFGLPNSANILWRSPSGNFSNFQVYMSTSPVAPLDSAPPVPITGQTFFDMTSYNVSGLNSNTTYYYWVRTICLYTNSSWIAGGSFTTTEQIDCNNASYGLYPSLTYSPNCTGSSELISQSSWAGEFTNVNISPNRQYTFSSSVTTDYITITNTTGTTIFASGASGTTWNSGSYTGIIRYYLHTNNACGEERSNRSRYISCIEACTTPIPSASDQALCNRQSTVAYLTATGTALKWYTTATGGSPLSSSAFVNAGTYYVSQTLNGCESVRNAVSVTIFSTPAPTASNQTFCNGATVANLTATGTDLKWYTAGQDTVPLTATTLLISGQPYYVTQTINGCESNWTEIAVTINTTVAPTASAQTFCNGATVSNLIATGTALKWYTATTGGTALTANTVLSTRTYYVSQTLNSCESTRNAVSITINTTPAPTATAQTFCNSAIVSNLTATGTALKWYSTVTAGTQLASTATLATGTYYVSQTLNACESPRTAVSVTVNSTPAPAATSQTFCNGATIANLTATGTALKWYSAATGGIQLASTATIATGTYYVSQTLNGCESPRTAVSVIINITPAPTATAQTFCNGATVANLTATGNALKWYSTATSGTQLASTAILATGTYYVSQTLNACESSRTAFSIIINITPTPTATAQTFCNSATVANLTATGTDLKWYSAATGGTQLASTATLATGTYYVSQTQNACESLRTAVSVIINTTPAPTATSQTFCNGATVANLTATGTALKWYGAATGGTQLASIATLATATYYVSQTLNSCESARTAVSVIINTTPAPTATAQIFCNGATVANLTATGIALKWYTAATGGTALTANTALTTRTYYVSQTLNGCESARNAVSITINTTPAPTATAQTFCNSAIVSNLTATGTALKWYSTVTAGTQLASTATLATGTYYVSQTLNACESLRTAVSVTINITPAPTALAQTFCNGATVANLTATGTSLQWYASATSGSALSTAATLSAGTYYVSQTLNACESVRTAVSVIINITPAPTATSQTFCNGATVANLSATGTALKWYSSATGGTQLASIATLATGTYYVSQTLNSCESPRTAVSVIINITPAPTATAQTFCNGATVANLAATGTALKWYPVGQLETPLAATAVLATGTYFVTQTVNGCEGPATSVNVTVNTTSAPIAIAQTFCNGATVANLTATGTSLKWYGAATGGTQLASTATLATGTYYVSQTLNACESIRTAVSVIINTTPAPTATAQTFCNGATVANLTATGTSLQWYASATSGSALSTATTLSAGTYYVSQTLNACESVRTAVSVIINITPAPTATLQTFCNGATVANLTATGTTLKWYSAATGGTQLASTATIATGTYYVSQTLNACESLRTAVSVIINITAAPTAAEQTFCNSANVAQLSATGTGLQWYAAATGGTALTSTDILATGTYYVSQTVNACESVRTAVSVIINTTAAPTATEQTFCNSATVANLTAIGTGLQWYASATGGSALASTDVLATGTYYVSQTLNACESVRTAVSVIINSTPAPIAVEQTFCNSATVAQLSATGTGLQWYADATGGTALTSTDVLATGTYYVSQTVNACESVRSAVSVIINTTAAPIAAEQSFCNGATVAQLSAIGTGLQWYAAVTGGTALTSTDVLATGTYYVSQTVNACESIRTAVSVIINTTAAPATAEQAFCNSATVAQLSATGTGLQWYAAATGGTALTSTATLATGTYYVSQTVNACESVRTAVSVIINSTPAPIGEATQSITADVAADAIIEDLIVTADNILWYASEEDALNGGIPLATDTQLVNGATYYATQTINGCTSQTVLAVTVTVTLGVKDVVKDVFKYYPNPVVTDLNIQSSNLITNVAVYDMNGKLVLEVKWNSTTGKLNMAHLQSASYNVRVTTGNTTKNLVILKK